MNYANQLPLHHTTCYRRLYQEAGAARYCGRISTFGWCPDYGIAFNIRHRSLPLGTWAIADLPSYQEGCPEMTEEEYKKVF